MIQERRQSSVYNIHPTAGREIKEKEKKEQREKI